MKPGPVLGTQGLIGPPKEIALFLGTSHKQAIGVGDRMALLKSGRFTSKALQTTPHVQHFWMRLTIHGFHIVQSLVLPTKQQTRLNGTFDIGPSLLRLACLQTHVVARAHHGVHRTGWWGVLGFGAGFLLVIHVGHGKLRRRCLGRLVHRVIQFFHHFSHSGSGFFHDLSYYRITVLRRRVKGGPMLNRLLLLLLILPGRGSALGRFSLPSRMRITRWRDRVIAHIDGHPGKGELMSLPRAWLFIPLNLLSHWSPFHTHIRSSRCPIGQLSLFKTGFPSLGLHSK